MKITKKVRVYEYMTRKKYGEYFKKYGVGKVCAPGKQRLVYDGTTTKMVSHYLSSCDIPGYKMTNYDVIEFICPLGCVNRYYFMGNQFYPMDMYKLRPDINWDSK